MAIKPDLLKIRVDDNLGSGKKMPEAAWRATIARAQEVKLPIATHIFYLSDAKAVLAAGSTFIAHSVRDVPVDAEFIKMLKARDACYSPTLMREVSTFVLRLDTAVGERSVLREGLGDSAGAITEQITDPQRQAEVQASNGYKQGLRYKEQLAVAKKNLKTLSDQGVRIAMGTDTGPRRPLPGLLRASRARDDGGRGSHANAGDRRLDRRRGAVPSAKPGNSARSNREPPLTSWCSKEIR